MAGYLLNSEDFEFGLYHLAGLALDSQARKANIVLFDGLNGNHDATWRPVHGSEPWYNEIIPSLVDVSIFGIHTGFRITKSEYSNEKLMEKRVIECAKFLQEKHVLDFPTVFIGYSNGGIFLKQLLCHLPSVLGAHYYAIRYKNLLGCCFLGVPHKGSLFAKIAQLALPIFGQNASQATLDLRPNARILRALNTQFDAFCKKLTVMKIISITESRSSLFRDWREQNEERRNFWMFLDHIRPAVSPTEAVIGSVSYEKVVHTNACHRTIATFEHSCRDQVFEWILERFQKPAARDAVLNGLNGLIFKQQD